MIIQPIYFNKTKKKLKTTIIQKSVTYARYGSNMKELVKHVNGQINRFKKRPYGPLGDYICLSDSNAAY
ncbi:hypothetical protein BLOT_012973 [Blomia tropicalis]|nr:hypothetical protein BLOT_012973 [Blomia tropicalis]